MGYYTNFQLGIYCDINGELLGDSRRNEVMEYICQVPDSEHICSFADSVKEFPEASLWDAIDTMKWYELDDDMKALSLHFADIVFLLTSKGEKDKDLWRRYYLNGKVHECQAQITITYDKFDPSQLK
jgi:hypothetical protein